MLLSSDYKTLPQDGGYWQEQIPKSEAALCAAIDPAADFRWHSLNCGGPETASFICELPGMYKFVLSSVTSGEIQKAQVKERQMAEMRTLKAADKWLDLS